MLTYLKLRKEIKIKVVNWCLKCKAIWTKSEDFKNILNVLSVYDDRYIKAIKTTYGDKIYANICGLNVTYKITNKQMTDYLNENLLED